MSTTVTVRGVAYTVPTSGDVDWAAQPQALYVALAAAVPDAVENWSAVGSVGKPAFENLWANYATGTNAVAFYIDPLGVVHLTGAAKDGSGTIFTLPVGYRPPGILRFTTPTSGGQALIKVDSTGAVVMSLGSNIYVYLDGITFRAS